MPPEETMNRIGAMEIKINAIYISVEKTRKYFLWMMIGSVALVVFPLIGLVFAIPSFMSTYSQLGGLGNPDTNSSDNAELKSLLEGL